MIAEPGRWIDEFVAAGCDSITLHVEVEPTEIRPALERIRHAGRAAGLSVKPKTPLEALGPYRDLLDIVLVMTVEPGFGGQSFMADVARAKLRAARDWLDPDGAGEVQVDGGANRASAGLVAGEGTDVMVVGSALYRAPDLAAEVAAIRAIADEARASGEHARSGAA
jgi:ribulose-phosphate 3-epimerase